MGDLWRCALTVASSRAAQCSRDASHTVHDSPSVEAVRHLLWHFFERGGQRSTTGENQSSIDLLVGRGIVGEEFVADWRRDARAMQRSLDTDGTLAGERLHSVCVA